MKPVLFWIAALVAWMPTATFGAKYASEYPVSVLVVTSKTRAFHNEVIDVRVEVRNRAPEPQSVPDPESLELGFEHIPGDGSQLVVYTDYRVEPSPPRMITIDGLSSRVFQRRFTIPADDGTVVVRVFNWPCVPCPVIVDAKEEKAAEPGATDNPDDAQCLREDHRVRTSPAGCLSFIVGQRHRMATDDSRSISVEALGMTQAQVWRYFAEGPASLTPEQLSKMRELYPHELEESREPSVSLSKLKARYFEWLEKMTAKAPVKRVRAYAVCLYEGFHYFEADLLGCPSYVAGDSEWACTWCYFGKIRFQFCSDSIPPEWEEGLSVAKAWFSEYLRSRRPGAAKIRKAGVAAIGFSDGDLHMLLPKMKTAQPGATDNPDGAQRLREDH